MHAGRGTASMLFLLTRRIFGNMHRSWYKKDCETLKSLQNPSWKTFFELFRVMTFTNLNMVSETLFLYLIWCLQVFRRCQRLLWICCAVRIYFKNFWSICNVHLLATENFGQACRICDFQSVAADHFRVFKQTCSNLLHFQNIIAPPYPHSYTDGERIEKKLQKKLVKTQLANQLITPRRTLFKLAHFLAKCYFWW